MTSSSGRLRSRARVNGLMRKKKKALRHRRSGRSFRAWETKPAGLQEARHLEPWRGRSSSSSSFTERGPTGCPPSASDREPIPECQD